MRRLAAIASCLCSLGLSPGAAVAVPAGPTAQVVSPTRARLERDLTELASWVDGNGGRLSAAFAHARGGASVAGRSAARPQNPASVLKLLTALTALEVLGPAHRFRTRVRGVIADGVAPRLVLVGDGDPSLDTKDIDALVATLLGLGLTRVDGDIVVDQSHFDAQLLPPGFEARPKEAAAFRAAVSPVSLAQNAITVHVAPAADGKAARVWLTPAGVASLEGGVRTAKAGSGQKVGVTVAQAGQRLRVRVSGAVAEGHPIVRLRRRVDDPTATAGRYLLAALGRAGVRVSGAVVMGSGAEPILAEHQSADLSVLIHALGKRSDNFTAEVLLKAIGGRRTGSAGASSDGADAILALLRRHGPLEPATRIRNGSGLYDGGNLSANALVRALVAAHGDPRLSAEFLAHLAVGGVDGTLAGRFQSHAAARSIRAKTGTLAQVTALAGYLVPPAADPLAFAVLIEGKVPQAEARARIDRLVSRALASTP